MINIIIGGDFNCTLTPRDKLGGAAVERKNDVISEITKLCDLLKLQDVWRCQHPNESQFTWRDKAFKVQCRLDYWLVYKEDRNEKLHINRPLCYNPDTSV